MTDNTVVLTTMYMMARRHAAEWAEAKARLGDPSLDLDDALRETLATGAFVVHSALGGAVEGLRITLDKVDPTSEEE